MPDSRRHRGAHPEDARDFGEQALGKLRDASTELSFLLSRTYRGITIQRLRKRGRPLSSRHPAIGLSGTGHRLVEIYKQVIAACCYVPVKRARWKPVRNFLRSEIGNLPVKHEALTKASSALGEVLRSGEVSPQPEAVLTWVCR